MPSFSCGRRSASIQSLQLGEQRFLVTDLTSSSHASGIEISGLIGLEILSVLEIKLDYRDNLMKLTYTRHY